MPSGKIETETTLNCGCCGEIVEGCDECSAPFDDSDYVFCTEEMEHLCKECRDKQRGKNENKTATS